MIFLPVPNQRWDRRHSSSTPSIALRRILAIPTWLSVDVDVIIHDGLGGIRTRRRRILRVQTEGGVPLLIRRKAIDGCGWQLLNIEQGNRGRVWGNVVVLVVCLFVFYLFYPFRVRVR